MNTIPVNPVNREIIRYNLEVDIPSIFLKEGKAIDSKWLDNDIIILLSENNEPLEIEIHNARQKGLIKILQQLQQYLKPYPLSTKPADK